MRTRVDVRTARLGGITGLLVCLGVVGATAALALWAGTASGAARSNAMTLPTPTAPTVSSVFASHIVTVSWTAPTGGAPVAGYEIRAYEATTGVVRAVGGTCAGLVVLTTCLDLLVPSGTWKYSVAARQHQWAGAESPRSAAVTVTL